MMIADSARIVMPTKTSPDCKFSPALTMRPPMPLLPRKYSETTTPTS